MHDVVPALREFVFQKAVWIKRADDTIFNPWGLSRPSPLGDLIDLATKMRT
ncbi:MAG: hypothetical protein VCB07_01830 [Gammaproteobacteria bacterium]